MKLSYYFVFASLLVLLFSGCKSKDNAVSTSIDLNPLFQTQEDENVGFGVVPITSELFLSTFEQPANGEIISTGAGRYLYVPEKHFNGRDSVRFTLSDNTQGTITFEVTPVNDAPVAGDDVIVSIDGEKVTIPVLFNDLEFDTDDSLRISNIMQPDQGNVTDNGDGTVDFSPPENFVGMVRFSYEVSDLSAASDRADVDVFVISGEARLTSIELTPTVVTLQQGTSVQFKTVATFADSTSADITTVAEWLSSDPTLLSFGDKPEARGIATANARGSVSVSASFDGISVSTTTVNILSKVPAAPASISGEYVGNGVIALDWPAVIGVDHYNVYRSTANQRTQVVSRVTPPFQYTGNVLGVTYYFMVRAVNADGLEGKPSTRIAVKPQALPTKPEPVPPEGVAATVMSNQIQLSWQAAANADYYVLYWSNTLPLEPASANRIEVTGTTFVHENLDNGLDYHYAIASSGADTESALGTVISVTLPPNAPVLTAEAGDASIALSWNAVTGADTYRLYWSTSLPVVRDDSRRFEIAATEPLTINHDGLNNGEAYHYLIVAVNKGGESPSGLVTVVPMSIQEPPPAPPKNIMATLNSNQIELGWDPVDNASYNVYWSTTTPVDIAVDTMVSVTSPSYILQGLLSARSYYFVVSSVVNGVESVPSSPEIRSSVPPDVPDVIALGGKQQVTLTWNGVIGADGYTIYWAEKDLIENTSATPLLNNVIDIDTNNDTNTYVHDNLINGNTYYYFVTAHYAGEESDGIEVQAIPRDYTVTKTEDTADGSCDEDCSLREAIIAANLNPGKETIIVPQGTYILSIPGEEEQEGLTGDLDIVDDFILLGSDAATTIIDADGLDRVLDLSVNTGHIIGFTVRNGFVGNELGGGIYHRSGELRIDNSIISDNRSEIYGGGIANRGDVECAMNGSDGGLGALGGGCPVLTINHSVLSNNCAVGSGSAIENFGLLMLNNSTVSANGLIEDVCSDNLGVIHTQYGVTLIQQSTLIDNTAGSVLSEWDGTVVITSSTIANNQTGAGAIATGAFGKVSLINSTISGNKKEQNYFASNGAPLEMANTLVANNINAEGVISDCSAINNFRSDTTLVLTSLGNNLIGDSITDCESFLTLVDSDLTGDADLGAFVNNDEPGSGYYPLLAYSQAVDAGGSEYCASTDQRGNLRPADGNGDTVAECDIGAFELAAQAGNQPSLVAPMVHAIGGDAQVTLMWNGVSGAVSYNIYWLADNDDAVPVPDNVIQISSRSASNVYLHEQLNNDSTYSYSIKAVSSNGEEGAAGQVSVITNIPE